MTANYNPAEWKRCHSCRSVLPVAMFGEDASQEDGHTKACRTCRALVYKRHREAARLRDSRNHARRKAAMWRDRYAALVAALPDSALDLLPEDVRPNRQARTYHRSKHTHEEEPCVD